MAVNYFTCTLGQAASLHTADDEHETTPEFANIPSFIAHQAQIHANLPAVGFYIPSSTEKWQHEIWTFQQVHERVSAAAEYIAEEFDIPEKQTVALLCPSNQDFLLVWLALMDLGHPVLLIAPQCSPSAVAGLCEQCGVEWVFFEGMFGDLAGKAKVERKELRTVLLPDFRGTHRSNVSLRNSRRPRILPTDVAYLHHTSGTSSGMPKPIPQSHRAGAGVQPRLHGEKHASFTTTPLYHGGVADLFRAWTSSAMIWLFPGKDLPITALNVVKCLGTSSLIDIAPRIEYFSSVPYVLEMMASDGKGLEFLQKMEMVGVGGAALPIEVGNRLVEQGVNLVSRYGSAECGFLMSSHRDYARDKEWQYLRSSGPGRSAYLRFEERNDGLSELVVQSGWPHMAKTNGADGSFATSDLFAPHPEIKDAWRYHSRADAQLTLVTGKKFDPSPLESTLAASSSHLQDVLIFGNGRPYPGALLFRSLDAERTPDEEFVRESAPIVEKMNRESQSHARIPRNMLIPLPYSAVPLEKSSKGTILRNQAEERYAAEIERAYAHVSVSQEDILDSEVDGKISEIVRSVVGTSHQQLEQLGPDTDLFAYGVDSVACIQIRHALLQLLPKDLSVSMTVVHDAGTIRRLSDKVLDLRHGRQQSTVEDDNEDQIQQMRDFVKEYSQLFPTQSTADKPLSSPRSPRQTGRTVLLTGPTGSLGSHLLSQLVASSSVAHIHLLLRGANQKAAEERVLKALQARKLPTSFQDKVSVHICALAQPRLGLSEEIYRQLASELDIIYHLAWSVDFILPMRGFKQHFSGLQSLLELVLAGGERQNPARLIFCSSTASVSSYAALRPGSLLPEDVCTDPQVSGTIGYSRSKWVAENICHEAIQAHLVLEGHVNIVRVGQVSGDTVHGIWNKSEAYPLMLASAEVTGCLPDLQSESLDWVPVDIVAEAFVELGLGSNRKADGSSPSSKVTYVLNPDRTSTWSSVVSSVAQRRGIGMVSAGEWLARLEGLRESGQADHPSLKLLDFWKRAYSAEEQASKDGESPRYDMEKSLSAMPVLLRVKPVDEAYVRKLWSWVDENM